VPGVFAEVLRRVASRVPETQVLVILGGDGIPVDRLVVVAQPGGEAVGAEWAALLSHGLAATGDAGLGAIEELLVSTDRFLGLLVAVGGGYFVFAGLSPGALVGRARFALRLAAMALRAEFE
jgi:predicted regulator of Ras-like GTPase activity (Roadblock/LC7/MglB family)